MRDKAKALREWADELEESPRNYDEQVSFLRDAANAIEENIELREFADKLTDEIAMRAGWSSDAWLKAKGAIERLAREGG